MNSSTSRSSSRSRSRSRSRGPRRRRSPRSRSHSGSGDKGCGGSGQGVRRGSSKDRSRKRRRSRSEDQDTPHRPQSNALVPVEPTRHATEESSDSSEDDDRLEGTDDKSRSRNKKFRKVDVSNPLSTFRNRTRHRKLYIMSSRFVRDEWLSLSSGGRLC